MSTIVTRAELRVHYSKIQNMIAEERALRQIVLANSPKLRQKLQRCDDALASLAVIGNALASLLPAEEQVVIQEALFEVPQKGGY
ncbi:MAG: hypothetical protein DYG89_15135 [Caldilinea sp. CFX5]|nr:hypothetical protein [Caldilinea sp. CFX5]